MGKTISPRYRAAEVDGRSFIYDKTEPTKAPVETCSIVTATKICLAWNILEAEEENGRQLDWVI